MAASNDLTFPSLQKLNTTDQMELLDVVDSLRACGLSEIVSLPQLIVCGDQSSGKSSVLEAISGIPFPKQDNLCTRFATEVILRRAGEDKITVSIIPGKDRTPVDRERLMKFSREIHTKDDFSALFEISKGVMGLSTNESFSDDVLRVEFCGPSQPQLTLVDLPGLIHSETKAQTPGDVKLVHDLISRYIQNPRSIILAVVSAKNDISNQIILNKARQVDPRGLRTLGIITKPDLLVKGSMSEEGFIALGRNEEVKFALGWHVVKNVDSAINKNQQDDRDQQETVFFRESNFNRLPTHTIGISFLRARLSKVLFNQIRTELPRLIEDIQIQISAAKLARDKLGPSRAGVDEQRSFLISLSQSFQTICRDAIKGNYDEDFFCVDLNPERRVCANIMNMHFKFAKELRENGARWLVSDEDVEDDTHRTREEAIKEACILLRRSRGRELPGLPNPFLVGELFRQYSQPWGNLARIHIQNVWEATNRFLELLLRYLTDDDVCENMSRFWLGPIMEQNLNSAYAKLDELLEVHKDHPMTTNSQFIPNSKKQKPDIDNINFFPTSSVKLDMDMVAAEEAFDNMNAYYEVAMNLFMDNVPTLAIQIPIVREVPKILCPTAVFSMETDIITRIAGETKEKILERDSILQRLSMLENGARICKQYAKRPQPIFNPSLNETDALELPVVVQPTTREINQNAHSAPPPEIKSLFTSLPKQKTQLSEEFFRHISTSTPKNNLSTDSPQVSAKFSDSSSLQSEPSGASFETRGSEAATSKSPQSSEIKSSNNLFGKTVATGTFPWTVNKPSLTEKSATGFAFAPPPSTADQTSAQNKNPGSTSGTPLFVGGFFGAPAANPFSGGGFGKSSTMTSSDSPKMDTKSSTAVIPHTRQWGLTWTIERDRFNSKLYYRLQHICCMPEFQDFSCEELRLADYNLGQRYIPQDVNLARPQQNKIIVI